jgi:hypothetical protein
VIKDEDDGRIEWDVFDTRNLDALEINPQRKPHERNNNSADH